MKAARTSATTWMRSGAIAVALSFASTVQAQAATAAAPSPRTHSTQIFGRAEAHRDVSPLDRRVSLDLQDVPLEAALEAIDEQAKLGLSYTARLVPLDKRVSIRVDSVTAKRALEQLLQGTGLRAVMTKSGTVILERYPERATSETVADSGVVYGLVRDSATGKPLTGAVVSVEGTSIRFVTRGDNASYYGKVPAGVHTLTVRMLGYIKAARQVVVVGNQNVRADFALRMNMSRLQEVVTTATGPKRRYELGNDVTIINADSIVATQPISSVTDLLEGRVPGLVVMRTSGAPGDPARIRLRGAGSALRSNDPIVIVDGVRIYYAQSDSTSNNIARLQRFSSTMGSGIPAPSPLDQLDPNTIETIQVLKGPSATTFYGPDAANGVIVITTKRGESGPARWTASVSHGMTYMPGEYPEGVYRWGTSLKNSRRMPCTLTQFDCQPDGDLIRFQALNDPRYTVLGHGANTKISLGVSGGTNALTYALTGSYADETGILTLPDTEAARFRAQHGSAPPSWMQRPQRLTRWSGTSRLIARLGPRMDASLSTMLTRQWQQRSNLERELATLMRTYIDPVTGAYWRGSGVQSGQADALIPDFYQRATDEATNFTNAATLTWRPRTWLTTSAQAGLNVLGRHDQVLLPRNMVNRTADTAGTMSIGNGTTVTSTVNLNAIARAPLFWGFNLQIALGANYIKTSNKQFSTQVRDLAAGTSSLNRAGEIVGSGEIASDVTSFGWYLEPSFTHRRFTISTGLRLDGSSSFGADVKLPAFPKLGVSWLISDEPFFPFKNFFDVFRVRMAYGQAGVWPGPADRLRLFTTSRPFLDSTLVDVNQISTLGNTEIRPERSTEIEGGFDADLFDDRLSIGITAYRKMRYDALMQVPVPPSVYGNGVQILRNIGTIRNTGLELNVSAQLVRSDPITWSTTLNLSRNRNLVTELGKGVEPFYTSSQTRIAPGYPLFGQWAEPILGYGDINGDGIIEASEVQVGDTAVFMGETVPGYEANVTTTLSLFRGTLTASAGLGYQDGFTQINRAMDATQGGNVSSFFLPGLSDPSAPLSEQAAVAVMEQTPYGLLQTVSTLRLTSLSVAYNAPPSLARRLGARAISIALQGTNLGLWTDYRGKDPNVNAFASGNAVADTGILPMPRQWLISVRASF